MSEQNLCNLGKKLKKINYFDLEKNQYIQIIFKLKEEITPFDLVIFFNQLYHAKLDLEPKTSFQKNYTTKDFITCLKNIITKNGNVTLKNLAIILAHNEKNPPTISPTDIAVQMFSKMFEITNIEGFSPEEYQQILASSTKLTPPQMTNEDLYYNTQVMTHFLYQIKTSSQNKTKQLVS